MESLRPLLITYAYNITGSLEDAKDIVQDTYLHYLEADRTEVKAEKPYLVRAVINRAINHKKQRPPGYPGEWLPEPVATEQADQSLIRKDVLSYSLMVLMEKLDPRQRAVFILKEAFNYHHDEIADILHISTDLSRQILRRARRQLDTSRKQSFTETDLRKYQDAIKRNDIARLEQLLNEDIAVLADGGGKAIAALKPVYGRKDAIALITGLFRKLYVHYTSEFCIINHQPAFLYYSNGRLVNCQVFTIADGGISHIYNIRNPDKISHLQK